MDLLARAAAQFPTEKGSYVQDATGSGSACVQPYTPRATWPRGGGACTGIPPFATHASVTLMGAAEPVAFFNWRPAAVPAWGQNTPVHYAPLGFSFASALAKCAQRTDLVHLNEQQHWGAVQSVGGANVGPALVAYEQCVASAHSQFVHKPGVVPSMSGSFLEPAHFGQAPISNVYDTQGLQGPAPSALHAAPLWQPGLPHPQHFGLLPACACDTEAAAAGRGERALRPLLCAPAAGTARKIKTRKSPKSKFVGVSTRRDGKFKSVIVFQGECIFIGAFETEADAILHYDIIAAPLGKRANDTPRARVILERWTRETNAIVEAFHAHSHATMRKLARHIAGLHNSSSSPANTNMITSTELGQG